MSRHSVATWQHNFKERHATASPSHLHVHLIGAYKQIVIAKPIENNFGFIFQQWFETVLRRGTNCFQFAFALAALCWTSFGYV
jgi:hypothetical protein